MYALCYTQAREFLSVFSVGVAAVAVRVQCGNGREEIGVRGNTTQHNGANVVFRQACVCEFSSPSKSPRGRCSHSDRVVAEPGRVGHRLPWQPEGKPFHPAGGISCQGRVKQPENPSLHPPYPVSFLA